jgi:hypothetical protein
MVNGGTGPPTGEGPEGSAGISILMGGDLPDHNRLIGFGVSRSIGDEPGFKRSWLGSRFTRGGFG